jgi:cephalosporin-C deacetylase-like acetyl esterase
LNSMLTRRRMIAAALSAPALRAQTHYREYARCLPDYLSSLAAAAYARRNQRLAGLRTPDDIRNYQAWARATFIRLVGTLPDRSPLNIRTIDSFERDRYRVERLVYESRPGLIIPANLYIPKSGAAPYPGVLFQMGHSAPGKAYPLYQRCCQGLVQLGYIVLAFDPIGQGERASEATPPRSPTQEHSALGNKMLLVGETATGAMLWDAMRSLDVLAAHPLVDARRLASTGQSGGGTLTMILAAMDDRLAAAAVSSGNTENFAIEPFLAPGSSDDAEQDLIGSGPLGFDRWDMLWPIAPKPLLVAVSAHDFFGTYSPAYERSGREEFARLTRAYELLGAPDRIEYFEQPLPHSLSYPMRLAIYNWFERHLNHSARAIDEEPPTNPEPDATLWCGKTGASAREFGGTSPGRLVAERARSILTPEKPGDLRALLGMEPPPLEPKIETRGRTAYRNCTVLAVEIQTAQHVWCPAWIFVPKRAWSRMLLVIEPTGRNVAWHEDELYDQLATAGIAVCAPDVRGVGDLQGQFAPGAVGYARGHSSEDEYAWASLILGRSLLGQRAADIVAYVQALAREYPRAELALAAREKMTVPAVCAAALEPRVSKVHLVRHLSSWRSVAESENYTCPLANVVPGALAAADLPQIARSLAPRQVTMGGAWDVAALTKAVG